MIKIAIVDDELVFTEQIAGIVEACRKNEVQKEIKTYNKPIDLIWGLENGERYDIYVLDIEMPDMDGLALAHQVRQYQGEAFIIFVTFHEEYGIKGYECRAWRYILKSEMDETMPEIMATLFQQVLDKCQRYYTINMETRFKRICYDDIIYLVKSQSNKKNVAFKTLQGEEVERISMMAAKEKLDDDRFFFLDRTCIINLQHVMAMKNGDIEMRTGIHLNVLDGKFQAARKAVADYWKARP